MHSYYTGFSSFELLKKTQETTFEQYYRFIQKYEEHGWSRHHQKLYDPARLPAFIITACWCLKAQPPSFRFNESAHISSGVLVNDIMHAGAILPVLKHLWCAHLDSASSHNCDVRPQGASMHGCTCFRAARRGRRPSFSSLCAFSHSWALRGWHLRWRGLYRATHSHSSATDGF